VPLSSTAQIRRFYRILFRAWGRQHWWPAQSPFEVILGAYLTQNTAWTNVERALSALRAAEVLSLEGVRATPLPELEKLIRSAGYFRQKARRLKIFVEFLDARYGGLLERMFAQPTAVVREQLLALNGVGPETADSILLYAGHHPVFVVDAYTRRILARHDILPENAPYQDIRALFERALGSPSLLSVAPPSRRLSCVPPGAHRSAAGCRQDSRQDAGATPTSGISRPEGSCHLPSRMSTAPRTPQAQVFSEMHGLIVGVGKNYCLKSKPRCEECPLGRLLPDHLRSSLRNSGL
jgi:endonuclease III related protein